MTFSKSDFLAFDILDRNIVGGAATPHYTLSETIILPDGTGATPWTVARFPIQPNMQRVARLADNDILIVLTASLPVGDNGKTLPFYGIFDALTVGNLLYAGSVGANESPVIFEPTTNEIYCENNPFVLDDQIRIYNAATGIVNGGIVFVLTPTNNRFQISLTLGGAAITFTGEGRGLAAANGAIVPLTGEEVNLPIGNLRISE